MHARAKLRWIDLRNCLHTEMAESGFSTSVLLKEILRTIFRPGDGWNMQETRVIFKHNAETLHVEMKFAGFVQDCLAHKYALNLKGQSGNFPCGECENCIGRCAYFEDDSGFAHLQSPEYHKFRERTNERIYGMVDRIAHEANHCGNYKGLENA